MARYFLLLIALSFLPFSNAAAQERRAYRAPEFAPDWSHPGLHPDRIVLNFSDDPATTMSVTWRTSPQVTEAYAEIALATAAPKFWRNAHTRKAHTETMDASRIMAAEVVANYHSVTFTGLLPDTLYAYRVGNGKIWSEWIQFRTAAAEPKPFSFLYVGDAQNFILELWSRLIREGYRKAPDASFIIHAGDLVGIAHSEKEWQEWFTAGGWIHRMLPSIPVAGNHEYEPYTVEEELADIERLAVQWNPQFTLPRNGIEGLEETVYYIDYQDMRIIALNSNERQEEQAVWLKGVLENNPKKWTVVTYHHPLFSASDNRDNRELRELWKPLFDQYGVDLALQGHDHSYARGRVAPVAENSMNGVNFRDDETGTVYVVSVSGGKMYNLRPGWEDLGAQRDRAAENTQLFQVIRVDGPQLSFEAYTATGELYDAFDLIKPIEGGPNRFVDRQAEAIPARRHDNTIPFMDEVPAAIREKLLAEHPGFYIDEALYVNEPGFEGFLIQLEDGTLDINLKVDLQGNILEKEIEED